MTSRRFQPGRRLHRRSRCCGNPLAVVLDGDGLSDAQMAALRALDQPVGNHLPAAADRRRRRLPRAHLHAERRAAVRRPPDAGQLPRLAGGRRRAARRRRGGAAVRRRPGAHPARRRRGRAWRSRRRRAGAAARWTRPTVERIARCLGVPRSAIVAHEHCDNGPPLDGGAADVGRRRCWRCRPALGSERAARDRRRRPRTPAGGDARVRGARVLPGGDGLAEDPVTGSLNAGARAMADRRRPRAGALRRGAGRGAGARRPRARRARRRRRLDRRRTSRRASTGTVRL